MADISKVTLPNNETYDLKDSVARGGIGNAKLFYGTCSSAAADVEKVVTCSEFTANDLVAGTMINIKFDATNSGAVASLTLNVNGTGAKSIKYIYNNKLNNIPAAGYLLANNMYTFRYDGTNWVVQLMYNTDNNTTTVQDVYVGYNYGISGVNGYKQLSILMNDEHGLPTSLTTTNGTGTKTKATNGFQLGEMYYYNGSANVNAGEAGSSIYKYVSYDVDARYSFNCGSTLVAGKSLYLVGSIGDNGLFYLDDTWWTMSLPTSDDGKVYILVGNVVSTTKVHLIPFHPCYVYKNGGVQLYSPNYITDNYVPTTRKVNNKELSADVTLTASDVGALPADQILTVDQGGIGLSSVTPGNYIKANSSHTFGQLTPAQVLADIGALAASKVGAANGVAPLNNSSKIDTAYLPSYVDDVIEGYYYNNKFYTTSAHTTEIPGETGKIFVDLSTNKTYRYSGSAFVEVSQGSLVTISRNLTSGTKVGTITIDGTGTDLYAPTNTDTKNTAGSTDTSSEIYLVGATSQAANPQTYSHDTARVRANGRIVGSGYEFAVASAMGTTKATMVYDSTLEAIAFQFD